MKSNNLVSVEEKKQNEITMILYERAKITKKLMIDKLEIKRVSKEK